MSVIDGEVSRAIRCGAFRLRADNPVCQLQALGKRKVSEITPDEVYA